MQPTTAVFEPREDLGMRVDEFDNAMNQQGFIAHRIYPILTRSKQSGKFPRVKIEQLLQRLDTKRNSNGTYPRTSREFSDDDYDTEEHGLECPLDDRTLARYDDFIDAETFEGEVLENALLLDYEIKAAEVAFAAATYGSQTSTVAALSGGGGVQWSNRSSSNPNLDVFIAKKTIRNSLGMKPNALVVSWELFEHLINNTSLIDRLKSQNYQDARPGQINEQALAISLNLEEVIVADSLTNTMQQGVTAVLGDIWTPDKALLCRVARTNNPNERCLGRSVIWDREGVADGDRMGIIAETYYEEARRGGVLRRRNDWKIKRMFDNAGFLFTDVLA
jgi:hypothetical protein